MEKLDIRSDIDSGSVETIVMTQGLTKRKFVLLALGFLVFNSSTTFANDDDLEALNQRIFQLFEQGKYQEAIPIAEKALEVANENARSSRKIPNFNVQSQPVTSRTPRCPQDNGGSPLVR